MIVNSHDGSQEVMIPKKLTKIKIYENTASSIQQNICLSIVKITQDHYGPLGTRKDVIFKGVYINGGPSAALVRPAYNFQYKLQFVGDSLTSAFGDMSGSNPICFLRMRHNQNCLESWAAHLANKLNAQYRIEAESGKGVVKNQMGVTGAVMPILYTKTTSNSLPNSYHYQDKYTPDAIIFALGANDYQNPIKPFKNIFIFGFEKMLTDAAKLVIQNTGHYPKIIGVCFEDLPGQVCEYVKQAIRSFSFSYKQVYYLEVPKGAWIKGSAGCVGHPNIKGQRFIAESIYESIRKILEGGEV